MGDQDDAVVPTPEQYGGLVGGIVGGIASLTEGPSEVDPPPIEVEPAGGTSASVAEPSSTLLFVLGLAAAWRSRRRQPIATSRSLPNERQR